MGKTYTKNLSLEKHDGEEFYDINMHNSNMDALDCALDKQYEAIETLNQEVEKCKSETDTKADGTMITNSFNADFERYYGNVKNFEMTDFITEFGSCRVARDAWLGIEGVGMYMFDGPPSFTMSKDISEVSPFQFNNGEMITSDDYFYGLFCIGRYLDSDIEGISKITVEFTSGKNRFYYSIDKRDLRGGYNTILIKRSEFLMEGINVRWDEMDTLKYTVDSSGFSSGVIFSNYFAQFIKKDPIYDNPNPCQKSGVSEMQLRGHSVLVKDKEGIQLLYLDATERGYPPFYPDDQHYASARRMVMGNNFTAHVQIRIVRSGYREGLKFLSGNGFSIGLKYDRLLLKISGQESVEFDNVFVRIEDDVSVTLEVKGFACNLSLTKNGVKVVDYSFIVPSRIQYVESLGGYMWVQRLSALSVTEIPHAHHANFTNIAEVAKEVYAKPYCKISSSLNQTFSGESPERVSFDKTISDKFKMFDSERSAIVIKKSGVYALQACLNYVVHTSGYMPVALAICVNGYHRTGNFSAHIPMYKNLMVGLESSGIIWLSAGAIVDLQLLTFEPLQLSSVTGDGSIRNESPVLSVAYISS